MGVQKPTWSSSSFLLYLGGLTVLAAAISALQLLRDDYGDAGYVGWSALIFAVLALTAWGLRRRGEWLLAGVFAVGSVLTWGIFVSAVLSWWGWLASPEHPFDGFHVSVLLVAFLVFAAALVKLRAYRFPLLVAVAAAAGWYFVVDLVSNGGGWSAIVSAFVGAVFLIAATSYDRGDARPYGFWLHVAAGLAIGGAIVYYCHTSNWDFAVVAVAGVLYVLLGARFGRSSWAVLGAAGLLAAAVHYGTEWADFRLVLFSDQPNHYRHWVAPVMTAILGFAYVLLGLLVGRRRTD